ncbi:hypothetical protein VPH35_008796 [Triticum aestivum]
MRGVDDRVAPDLPAPVLSVVVEASSCAHSSHIWPCGLICGGFGERCAAAGMEDGGAAAFAFGGCFRAAITSGEVVRASVVAREDALTSGWPALDLSVFCRRNSRVMGVLSLHLAPS